MGTFIYSRILLVLITFTAVTISRVSADCTLTGLVFKCQDVVKGTKVDLKIEVKPCKNPAEVYIQLETSDFNWEKTVVGTANIPIPGLSLGGFAGFYLKAAVHNDDGDILLKVSMAFELLTANVKSVTILEEKIVNVKCDVLSIALRWWNSQTLVVKLSIGIGGGLLLLFLLCGCGYCCCPKKTPETFTVAPPRNQIGTVATTMQMESPVGVPYHKLDNGQY